MQNPTNTFKKALREGKAQIGLWCSLCSPIVTEVVAEAGFDWVLLDMEHAPNNELSILSQLHAVKGSPAHAVVRTYWNDMVLTKRLLDLGVQSFLIPMVNNVDEARQAVANTRYPPHGVRGVAAGARANRWGRVQNYFPSAHDDICVLVQAETQEAIANLDDIAGVEGVDGVFIGPMDLSTAMGHLANPGEAKVVAMIEDMTRRIRAKGKAAGIVTPVEAQAKHWLTQGMQFVAVGSDLGILARQTEALLRNFR